MLFVCVVQKKRRETWGGAGASIVQDDSADEDMTRPSFVSLTRGRSLQIGQWLTSLFTRDSRSCYSAS